MLTSDQKWRQQQQQLLCQLSILHYVSHVREGSVDERRGELQFIHPAHPLLSSSPTNSGYSSRSETTPLTSPSMAIHNVELGAEREREFRSIWGASCCSCIFLSFGRLPKEKKKHGERKKWEGALSTPGTRPNWAAIDLERPQSKSSSDSSWQSDGDIMLIKSLPSCSRIIRAHLPNPLSLSLSPERAY